MTNIPRSELSKLPYLTAIPQPPQSVPLLPYYDATTGTFRIWLVADGGLVEAGPSDITDGVYLSETPASPTRDCELPLLSLIYKHFCSQRLVAPCHDMNQDLISGLSFIEKYFILLNHSNTYGTNVMRSLVGTEIEAAFVNHRCFYDTLQTVMRFTQVANGKPQLPKSFRKTVQKEPEELAEKYGLPGPFRAFYRAKKDFFMNCRAIRDSVVHNGLAFYYDVFDLEDGFAVQLSSSPLGRLQEVAALWPEAKRKPNNLVSLLPVFCLLVQDMFSTMAQFEEALLAAYPPDSAPVFEDESVFLRTPCLHHLHKLDSYRHTPWHKPEDIRTQWLQRGIQESTRPER